MTTERGRLVSSQRAAEDGQRPVTGRMLAVMVVFVCRCICDERRRTYGCSDRRESTSFRDGDEGSSVVSHVRVHAMQVQL